MSEGNVKRILDASFEQQGFVVGSLSNPDTGLFVEHISIDIIGPISLGAVQSAWSEIVSKHSILRTAFAWDLDDFPRQVELNSVQSIVRYVDSSNNTTGRVSDIVKLEVEQNARELQDLMSAPLVRLSLIKHKECEHTLVWSHHHAVLDGWSQNILLRKLFELLQAPQQRLDVADDVFLPRQSGSKEAAEYWNAAANGVQPSRRLALTPCKGAKFAQKSFRMSHGGRENLYRSIRELETTASTLVTTIWTEIASNLWENGDIAIGLTVSGRTLEEAFKVGPYSSTIPVRRCAEQGLSARRLLEIMQNQVTTGSEYAGVPTHELADSLGLQRSERLFESIVSVANHIDLNGFETNEVHPVSSGITGFGGATLLPISIVVVPDDDFEIRVNYDRECISDSKIEEILSAFESALGVFCLRSIPRIEDVRSACQLSPFEFEREIHERPRPKNADDKLSIKIRAVFQEALGVDLISVDDNFFMLGGHSLAALEVLSKLASDLSLKVTLGELLNNPTPSQLATAIKTRPSSDLVQLPKFEPTGNETTNPFELTDIQQAYWVGRFAGYELSSVDAQIYAEVDVQHLDLDRLASVLNRLIQRHEMLRATFTEDGRQKISASVPSYHIECFDLSLDTTKSTLEDLRKKNAKPRRDVQEWPLFTIMAAKIDEVNTRLFLNFDMLIGDAKSWQTLYHEAQALYAGREDLLNEIEVTFKDYVDYLVKLRGSEIYTRDRNYWIERAPDFPLSPKLPQCQSFSPHAQHHFERRSHDLSRDLTSQLKSLCAKIGITPSAALLCVYGHTLSKEAASKRFALNLTTFSRPRVHKQIDQIVGDFTTLTLFEFDVDGSNFELDAKLVQEKLWSDLEHKHFSGVQFMRECRSHNNGEDQERSSFVFTSTLGMERELEHHSPISWDLIYSIGQTPQVKLDFQTYETAGKIRIIWDSVDGVFSDGLIDKLFADFVESLERISISGDYPSKRPEVRGDLPVSAIKEGGGALNTISPAEVTSSQGGFLHQKFLNRAKVLPDEIAVIDGDVRLTYADVLKRAYATSQKLDHASRSVGVCMSKGADQVIATLAVLLAGKFFVPIDPFWPSLRVVELMKQTDISQVIVDSAGMQNSALTECSRITVEGGEDCAEIDLASLDPIGSPSDLAYVIFTSGSTGTPKGVAVEHRAAVNTIDDINDRFSVSAEDSVLAFSALTFDLSIYDIFGPLSVGGRIVLISDEERLDPAAWARVIREERVSIWNSVPLVAEALVDNSGAQVATLESLRLVMLSGDWIPLSLPDRLKSNTADARIVSLGGATEAAIWSVFYEIGDVSSDWSSIPYGKALKDQEIQVLDTNLDEVPPGVSGEIYISGKGLARCYYNQPELTAQKFIFDCQGRRLYRTGDWGRYNEDRIIEFLGRKDDQVKISGYRIEIKEVEKAATSINSAGASCVGVFGEREKRQMYLFFSGDLSVQEIRAELSEIVPVYMVPSFIYKISALPKTSNGKLDRKLLKEMAMERHHFSEAKNELPVNDNLASALTDMVSLVTTRRPREDENLLALGVTSMDAIRLFNFIEKQTGTRPPVMEFFDNPTISQLVSISSATYSPSSSESSSTETVKKLVISYITKLIGKKPLPTDDLTSLGLKSIELIRLFNLVQAETGCRPDVMDFYEDPTLLNLLRLVDSETSESAVRNQAAEPSKYSFKGTASKADFPVFPLDAGNDVRALPDNINLDYCRRTPASGFGLEAVELEALYDLLACLRRVRVGGEDKFLYPSAGGLYNVDAFIYIHPGRVKGAQSGIFYYHPVSGNLMRVSPVIALSEGLHLGDVNADLVSSAAFTLFLTHDADQMSAFYGNDTEALGYLNAGYIGQLLMQRASTISLGLRPVHGFSFDRINELLPASDSRQLLHVLLGGEGAASKSALS